MNRTLPRSRVATPAFAAGPSASCSRGSTALRASIDGSAATRHEHQGRSSRRRQRRKACLEQAPEPLRDRHLPVRPELQPTVDDRAGHLECVERVARRRLLDPDEREPRERPAEPRQEQAVQCGEWHRPELHAVPSTLGHGVQELAEAPLDAGVQPIPRCHDESDRPVLEPPDAIGEGPDGRVVEPLQVIDRDDHRAFPGEVSQQRRGGHGERPLVG